GSIATTGWSLSIGPSWKNDGFDTLAIGAPLESVGKLPNAGGGTFPGGGRAYVVFGAQHLETLWNGSTPFDVQGITADQGFRESGPITNANIGSAVKVIPSWEGDGHGSVVINSPTTNSGNGAAWVLFGKHLNTATADQFLQTAGGTDYPYTVAANGTEGFFAADAFYSLYHLGTSVDGLDFDGDHNIDLAMGSPKPGNFAAQVTVVFGPSGANAADALRDLHIDANKWTFTPGSDTATNIATSMAHGHVHGDSVRDDLVIGSGDQGSPANLTSGVLTPGGTVDVVFGNSSRASIPTLPTAFTGSNGFRVVNGASNSRGFGGHVAVGDVNGDGIDDILIAENANYNYLPSHYESYGKVWVVFGKNGGLSVSQLDVQSMTASDGFSIRLPKYAYVNALTTANINGDSRADILIGSPSTQLSYDGDVYGNGGVFVVFGSATPVNVDIPTSALDGTNGFVALGEPYAYMGTAIAAGDVNGDTHDDVAVGASYHRTYIPSSGYVRDSGRVYLVFGVPSSTTLPAYTLSSGFTVVGTAPVPQ
ncbi:MAG TPA: hypothetical protein VF678_11325, partial [bacterium]